jgi:hypothetical protein
MANTVTEWYKDRWEYDKPWVVGTHSATLAIIIILYLVYQVLTSGAFDTVQHHTLPDGRVVTCISQNSGVSCDWSTAK